MEEKLIPISNEKQSDKSLPLPPQSIEYHPPPPYNPQAIEYLPSKQSIEYHSPKQTIEYHPSKKQELGKITKKDEKSQYNTWEPTLLSKKKKKILPALEYKPKILPALEYKPENNI